MQLATDSLRVPSALRAMPLIFGVTILISASLLFLVQPLIGKLILPWFGGSSAVWIASMLFFQLALLLGYLYAHTLTRCFDLRTQVMIHSVLLVIGAATLPISPNPIWQPRPGEDPTWRVFGVLAAAVGLPYVLLSSTSPLLQSWYTGTREGVLPYRYFAVSNVGSFVALLGYPALIEPHLSGREQAWMWSAAFAFFTVLCIGTAVLARRRSHVIAASWPDRRMNPARASDVLLWVLLAACASALLLSATNLLTQNVAPMPLLWVLPLSIYLLTFVLCFESPRWYKQMIFLPLVLAALACFAALSTVLENKPISVQLCLLCGALFVCCMACHGELARIRAAIPQLTSFYLCVGAGGALGGLFVALIAPRYFPATFEYPLTFVGCAVVLLIAVGRGQHRFHRNSLALPLWAGALAGTSMLAIYVCRETWRDVFSATLLARNFYGTLRVNDVIDYHNPVRELRHGTIIHGVQFRNQNMRSFPTTYYSNDSGIGQTWRILASTGALRMGVVGLGAGTLAAYGRAGDTLRFYEINPLVIRIAESQFTFLSDCPAHIEIVTGDARVSMSQEQAQRFDILVLDAFSGDAIPVHLLTREAFQLCWRHLKPDGVLAVHVSNRYLDLAPVVMLAAEEAGKPAWQVDSDDDDRREVFSSTYVLVSSRKDFFEETVLKPKLSKILPLARPAVWTDDYSDLWQVLTFRNVQ